MPGVGTTKHENPPLPPFDKGGMGGFSYKAFLDRIFHLINAQKKASRNGGAFFYLSLNGGLQPIRSGPIQDKKMVDGKGGSLKTIHHYKTERGLMTAPPFRLFPGGPPIYRAKYDDRIRTMILFRKKKSHALVQVFHFLFFLHFLPERPPPAPPHSGPGKNYTHQSDWAGRGVLSPSCCCVI